MTAIKSSNSESQKKVTKRTNTWGAILYPDSAAANWKEELNNFHVKAVVSPLHDQDTDSLGKPKKPHYHIMVLYDSLKSKRQAQELFKKIGAANGNVVAIESRKAYARYLCHLDESDKPHYAINDVQTFAGANYLSLIEMADSKYTMFAEMIEFCNENALTEYSTLCTYAMKEKPDWFRLLIDNGYFMAQYLRSYTWSIANKKSTKHSR